MDKTSSHKVAILLNANAKRVTPRTKAKIERLGAAADLFISHSIEHADEILDTILERGYEVLFTGGGDGTIVQTVKSLFHKTGRVSVEGQFKRDLRWLQPVPQHHRPIPAIGVLKLGTGNALASVVGAGKYQRDIQALCRAIDEGEEPLTLSLPFMESEGDVFPFGGLGWDAAILNDYNWLKNHSESPVLKSLTNTVFGYVAAALGITAPRIVVSRPPEVELRTLGEAVLLGPKGEVARRFGRGEVIYRGYANVLAFSTVPYYGYDLQVFPFAHNLTNRFQVRVSTMSVPEVLAHLPSIWRGTYRSPRLFDFHCERVTMSFSRPVPYQVGGDAKGERETLTVGLAESPVTFVDFRTALQPVTRPVQEVGGQPVVQSRSVLVGR